MKKSIDRREFTASALKATVAAGSLPALLDACATIANSRTLKPMPALAPERRAVLARNEFGLWRDIAEKARLVPTPHNTQPFRIRPRDAVTAEIVAVPDRFLPEEDHGNRYVASAFGIMAECVELAGRLRGRRVVVTPVDSVDTANLHRQSEMPLLGTATVVGEADVAGDANILELRRTSRIPYHTRLVAPDVWESLRKGLESHGQRLYETHDADDVKATLRLNAEAILDNLSFDRERKEIQHWYRTGPTPEYGDGLWEIPLNQDALEIRTAFGSPRLLQFPLIKPRVIHEYLRTQRGTRHIVLVCGRFDRWHDLVTAGRALFGMWTDMARHGVYIHPMGSMLTNAKYAAIVAERFGVNDCWLIMRAGYSDVPPRAPRLESILV